MCRRPAHQAPVGISEISFAAHEFTRGESVAAFLTAANRDPAEFENSRQFDITRRPNPHLSFGTGPHFCLGFQLARVEAAIAFERILFRFPDIRLAVGPASILWRKRVGIRTLSSLPVDYTDFKDGRSRASDRRAAPKATARSLSDALIIVRSTLGACNAARCVSALGALRRPLTPLKNAARGDCRIK